MAYAKHRRLSFAALIVSSGLFAQQPTAGVGGDGPPPAPAGPPVISPEFLPDHRVAFRINAPGAQKVLLPTGSLTGSREPVALSKNADGNWEVIVGPVAPGPYRYTFNVDGAVVVDPHNPKVSVSRDHAVSLFYMPGADFLDEKQIPHGTVSVVSYYSPALKRFRQMHVYTPPGYEASSEKYPIFYLLTIRGPRWVARTSSSTI
jgi:enterochelin esterase family protein